MEKDLIEILLDIPVIRKSGTIDDYNPAGEHANVMYFDKTNNRLLLNNFCFGLDPAKITTLLRIEDFNNIMSILYDNKNYYIFNAISKHIDISKDLYNISPGEVTVSKIIEMLTDHDNSGMCINYDSELIPLLSIKNICIKVICSEDVNLYLYVFDNLIYFSHVECHSTKYHIKLFGYYDNRVVARDSIYILKCYTDNIISKKEIDEICQ